MGICVHMYVYIFLYIHKMCIYDICMYVHMHIFATLTEMSAVCGRLTRAENKWHRSIAREILP